MNTRVYNFKFPFLRRNSTASKTDGWKESRQCCSLGSTRGHCGVSPYPSSGVLCSQVASAGNIYVRAYDEAFNGRRWRSHLPFRYFPITATVVLCSCLRGFCRCYVSWKDKVFLCTLAHAVKVILLRLVCRDVYLYCSQV